MWLEKFNIMKLKYKTWQKNASFENKGVCKYLFDPLYINFIYAEWLNLNS